MTGTVAVRLPADRTAPRRAREAVARVGESLTPEASGRLRLLVTELVASSAGRPGAGPIPLAIGTLEGGVVCGAVGGEGAVDALTLARGLTDDCGVCEHSPGVWFRLRR